MKKIALLLSAFVVIAFFVTTPALASTNGGRTQVTPTRRMGPGPTSTKTAQPTDSPERLYYMGVWHGCLTTIVQEQPSISGGDANNYCKQVLTLMLSVDAYHNRHSDMFHPLPPEIVIP